MVNLVSGPVVASSDREAFTTFPAGNTKRTSVLAALPDHRLSNKIILSPGRMARETVMGVPDDNRSVIFPDLVANVAGRDFALSVKGIGAKTLMYGDLLRESPFRKYYEDDNFQASPASGASRAVTGESWYGEEPWGALGEVCARSALEFTELATDGCTINGFHICPVVEINEFPADLLRSMHTEEAYWYRRYAGRYFQEQRLVPSNVRLFHQSDTTLGANPIGTLDIFCIKTIEDVDAFIEQYIASGIAALTLYARTLRPCKWGLEGLEYGDTWFDKDCVIAPDGSLCFADIEDLDWCIAGQDRTLTERVHHQFNRNFYEFMYVLDNLLRERERRVGVSRTQAERREDVATRFELAVGQDQFTRCERMATTLDIIIIPHVGGCESIPEHVVDLR